MKCNDLCIIRLMERYSLIERKDKVMGTITDITFLCTRLKELREKNNCTMDEMALKLSKFDNGIVPNKSSISRVEAGKTSEKTLKDMARKYCEAFGMSPAQVEQFMRGERIAVPDTSALFRNPQLIDELNSEYDKVIIPKVVIDELDRIKNNRYTDTAKAKKAWEIIRGISYGDRIILMEYTGDPSETNDDCRIIDTARAASEKYSTKVDIITDDTDYSAYLKGDENVNAIHVRDYMKKKQSFLNMERMERFDSFYLDSYDSVECPNSDEANGYLRDGNTLIVSAVRNTNATFEQRKNKILWLISCGADVDKRDNSRRYFPPLTHAVQKNDYEMVEFLLKECKANPNVGSRNPHDSGYLRQKNEGNMPLMVAAFHGRASIVRLLCEDSRISINQQDSNGFTALMKACMNGYKACRGILEEHNADERIVDINGMTAEDHFNNFLENGPAVKMFDRGNQNKKPYQKPYNNNGKRW